MSKRSRNIVGIVAVGGLAFAAGRFGIPGIESIASALPMQDREPSPSELAMMKAGTPGENHETLNALVGDFVGSFKMWMSRDAEPVEIEGSVNRRWILDGRYLRETVEASSEMGTFQGLGFVGYNNIDGQYEVAWLENQSTAIAFETGTYDPDTKTMTFYGSHRDPLTGTVLRRIGEIDLSDPDVHTYIGYAIGPDGRKFKSVEGAMRRRR